MKQILLIAILFIITGISNAQSCDGNGSVCPQGLTCYTPASGTGAFCVNPQTDNKHCGEVIEDCTRTGLSCVDGDCIDPSDCMACNTPEQECCDFAAATVPKNTPRPVVFRLKSLPFKRWR